MSTLFLHLRARIVIEDLWDLEEVVGPLGRVGKDLFDGQGWLYDVITKDVMDGQAVGERLDRVGIEFVELFDILDDGAKIGAELRDLGIVKLKPGKFGYLADQGFVNLFGHLCAP